MLQLPELGEQIAARRKERKLTQTAGELGYAKLSRILAVLGLEFALREASPRPTLDDLMEENRHDQSLGRRR